MDTYIGKARDDNHRKKIEAEDRDVAVQAVRRGFAAIAPAAAAARVLRLFPILTSVTAAAIAAASLCTLCSPGALRRVSACGM